MSYWKKQVSPYQCTGIPCCLHDLSLSLLPRLCSTSRSLFVFILIILIIIICLSMIMLLPIYLLVVVVLAVGGLVRMCVVALLCCCVVVLLCYGVDGCLCCLACCSGWFCSRCPDGLVPDPGSGVVVVVGHPGLVPVPGLVPGLVDASAEALILRRRRGEPCRCLRRGLDPAPPILLPRSTIHHCDLASPGRGRSPWPV